MTDRHLITREIGIDMGHRVTFHGSKCRNLHGHRYTIQATCAGPLFTEGEQQGMVLDFGFLKEEMMDEIDALCDHGTCLWVEDEFAASFVAGTSWAYRPQKDLVEEVKRMGGMPLPGARFGKLYLVPFVPTAENLARHWYQRLAERVEARTGGQASLVNVKVWETPNCSAEYPGMLARGPVGAADSAF